MLFDQLAQNSKLWWDSTYILQILLVDSRAILLPPHSCLLFIKQFSLARMRNLNPKRVPACKAQLWVCFVYWRLLLSELVSLVMTLSENMNLFLYSVRNSVSRGVVGTRQRWDYRCSNFDRSFNKSSSKSSKGCGRSNEASCSSFSNFCWAKWHWFWEVTHAFIQHIQ